VLRNWLIIPLMIGIAGCAVGAEETLFDALGQDPASTAASQVPVSAAVTTDDTVASVETEGLMDAEEQAQTVTYLQSLANAPRGSRSALSTNARALEALGASHGETALTEIEASESSKN